MMNKILIAGYGQFGALSDYYYWAKYLILEKYDVSFLGRRYDDARKMQERKLDRIRLITIPHSKLYIIFYTIRLFYEVAFGGYKAIILCPTPLTQWLPKLFPRKKIILDIRSESVAENPIKRAKENEIKLRRVHPVKYISFISLEIMRKFGYNENNSSIIPLGGEELSHSNKDFHELRLMYIGTLSNRKLEDFLKGLGLYQQQGGICTLDIIGGGLQDDIDKMKKVICEYNIQNVVFHGVLNHEQARPFFDKCNVGVCYVPKTEYYINQPTTKLYEYTLSGMACIATSTNAIKKDFSPIFGVLVNDTPESVCHGLIKVFTNMSRLHSESIRINAQKFHWRNVVCNYLIPIIEA